MQIIVILAGVADPKRPVSKPASGNWIDLITCPSIPLKLSPFDEAALEIALKLRDKNAEVKVSVIVTDGSYDSLFMRHVASFRPDSILGLNVAPEHRGDPLWLAQSLTQLMSDKQLSVDLWLIGREHGDLDDGVVPGFLGEFWSIPFVGLVSTLQQSDLGRLKLERFSRGQGQMIDLLMPAVVSVTNDKDNRLRHPLMKNVMLAKQLKFESITYSIDSHLNANKFTRAQPIDSSRRASMPCKILTGSIKEQAGSLAAYLKGLQKSGSINAEEVFR